MPTAHSPDHWGWCPICERWFSLAGATTTPTGNSCPVCLSPPAKVRTSA